MSSGRTFNPTIAFQEGLQFELSCLLLGNEAHKRIVAGRGVDLMSPIPVVGAFAAEVYLKCLQMLDRKSATSGHDLTKLFKALKLETQERTRNQYNRVLSDWGPINPKGETEDFDRVLSWTSRAFEDWRYRFERPFEPIRWFGQNLVIGLRLAIIEGRQDLAEAVPDDMPMARWK